MAKKKRYRHVTINPSQGGALIGSASDDVPITDGRNYLSSSANYTQKLNFRRETDGELRREGWEIFEPTQLNPEISKWGNIVNFDALDSQYPIRAIHQFPGDDGTLRLVAIAGNKMWAFMSEDGNYAQSRSPSDQNPYSTGPDGKDYWKDTGESFYWKEVYEFGKYMDTLNSNGTPRSPSEGGAYRWEFAEVKNLLIVNNGIDLPIIFGANWEKAEPLYGLRENGVISVGTICSYQDRLFCADLTVITKGYDLWFAPNAPNPSTYDPHLDLDGSGTVEPDEQWAEMTGIAEKALESGDINNDQFMQFIKNRSDFYDTAIPDEIWEDRNLNSLISEDYSPPVTDPVVDTPVSDPDHDPYGNIFESSLYAQTTNDALLTERFQYRMMYSAEGEPRLFNTGIDDGSGVVMESGGWPGQLVVSEVDGEKQYEFRSPYMFAHDSNGSMYKLYKNGIFQGEEAIAIYFGNFIITMPDTILASSLFIKKENDKYLVVDSSGDNVSVIYKRVLEGVPDDTVTDNEIEAGTYNVVIRPYLEQLANPASVREFSQDGSRILKMLPLADKLVVYRDSGYFFISRTNSAAVPFSVEPRYTGGRVADFRHTIIDIAGREHMFVGNNGVYSISRTQIEPKILSTFEIGPPFWQIISSDVSEFVYSVDNPITREMFINAPLGFLENEEGEYIDEKGQLSSEPKLRWGILAYDYINGTLSEIDASFTACAHIRKPKHNRSGPEEAWFVLGVHQADGNELIYPGTQYRSDAQYGGVLCRYGYGPPQYGASPYRLYSRLGEGYESKIKSGLIDFGDSFSDKEVRSYVLELSSKYGVTPVRVKISTTSAPQGSEEIETMQVIDGQEIDYVELNNLVDENMIPMFVRAPYIRDEITVLPEYDADGNLVNNPVKIVGRTFEVSGITTRATTQAYNQG